MFDSYKDIFNKRGAEYHSAMMTSESARAAEFSQLLQLSPLTRGQKVLDLPAGGCYFSKYLASTQVDAYFVDESDIFLNNSQIKTNVIKSEVTDTPFRDSFFDKVYSLAGTHHSENKTPFFEEVARILKPNGSFIYADVKSGSKEECFLNGFVNEYNSLGHEGLFLDQLTLDSLNAVNLYPVSAEYKNVNWLFNNKEEMVTFVKKLFGIDLADEETIYNAIKQILGFKACGKQVEMNWGLYYIHAIKSI